MGAAVILWLTAAAAQDPAPEPSIEITVWGELAVDKARDDIVRQIEALGYRVVRRGDDETEFRPKQRWKGHITFHDDGTFTYGRPVAGLTPLPPEVISDDPRYESLDPDDPMLTGVGPSFWFLPSKQKLEWARVQVLDATHDEVERYLAIERRTAFEQDLLSLPDRLDALWSDGTPLEPGPILASPDDRRRAVLELWATRADTPEGQRKRAAIEAWLAAVVQASATPITPEERAEYSARQPDRPLP